jgi:hypothetical protein
MGCESVTWVCWSVGRLHWAAPVSLASHRLSESRTRKRLSELGPHMSACPGSYIDSLPRVPCSACSNGPASSSNRPTLEQTAPTGLAAAAASHGRVRGALRGQRRPLRRRHRGFLADQASRVLRPTGRPLSGACSDPLDPSGE